MVRRVPELLPYSRLMRVTYDSEVDAVYIYLTGNDLMPGRDSIPCDVPDGVQAFVVLDWKDGGIVGLEVLDASIRLNEDLLAEAVRPGEAGNQR